MGLTNVNYQAFTNTFAVTAPFGITNIPVWVSNRFVYSPSVHRLLQLAANIYDASTNGNLNLPHVFRPLFEWVRNGTNNDIFIAGYVPVTFVSDINDPQLAPPVDVMLLSPGKLPGFTIVNGQPILRNGVPVNVWGVPWIIGAKKGLPAFNQFYLTNSVQVTRNLLFTRPKVGKPVYQTNQMFSMAFSTGLGVSFWNSYTNNYPNIPRSLAVFARDTVSTVLVASNKDGSINYWSANNTFYLSPGGNGVNLTQWPATRWSGSPPFSSILNPSGPNSSFLTANWQSGFLNGGSNSWSVFRFGPAYGSSFQEEFDPVGTSPTSSTWETTTTPSLPQLPGMILGMTNYLQAYILDGHNVIDYVQLRDPNTVGDLDAALADPAYPDQTLVHYQWSTNAYPTSNKSTSPSYGLYNQYAVSTTPSYAPVAGGRWANVGDFLPSSMQGVAASDVPLAEAAFFNAFFTPNPSGGFMFENQPYYNTQLEIQAPYTPTRTIYAAFLLQANDPLVHYLGSDLNAEPGASAVWANSIIWPNGIWRHVDDVASSSMPTTPATPVGGRYQPWGINPTAPITGGDANGYNLADRDPLAWAPDNWDFPTNSFPTVGWLGRVHRGTPWQTVYLKSSNILTNGYSPHGTVVNTGSNQWAAWTGDILPDYRSGQAVDGSRSAPVADRLLFDVFTSRFNDNSVRGTLPVNQSSLAAWSALFSGMVVLSNTVPSINLTYGTPLAYTPLTVNPAGADMLNSPLWQIVNGTNGINANRANTTNFPFQTYVHAGDVLQAPAISEQSPYLNWNDPRGFEQTLGISDELYEWLPQQMMGLVRASEPRYVLYCFGQTLRPAPNGTVLSGPYFQMVTNYQVTAESVVRAVIRIDGANTSTPHAVIESYNVLPPN